jgi:molecular chaperone DnaK
MVKEAERYAESRTRNSDEVEKLNNADAICYQAEKTLADFGEKLTEDLKSAFMPPWMRQGRHQEKNAATASERADKLKEATARGG